ncbi:MAG: tRNA (N(6)-L-threonylcarbamoyladenosine(37)-C(2))-methylthiotransferase MtaB [Ruminococcaceae bacterium]|nr:tRNA (N(6)-L-threonylcarbamoyladenosine(37)-C(2))-methylthiotransferase MtaB [Oscillospiraceae bacterium]
MQKSYTVGVLTLGCKVNQYESEAIAEAFEKEGFTVLHGDAPCDVYVINTCTVTAESDRKAGQLARRMHARNPNAFILMTGCFAQAAPEKVAAIEGVDDVCGNTDKLSVVAAAKKLLEKGRETAPAIRVGDVNTAPFEPMEITRFERTRAYVKIEDGCENRCSYCAIPGARGRVRSKPLADVVREVEGLVRGGCREVVLTGIETASWGRDIPGADLADLLEAVDAIPGIGRVRLGSLDPSLMKEKFVERIAALRSLTPHFHISMQSGSSAVLAAMKRKYNREQALAGIRRLRAAFPRLELTTDFIVGFPGETEADFAETVSFAKEAEFLSMHVFAYSKREGTVAASLPGQLPNAIKKERSAALMAVGAALRQQRLEKALLEPVRQVLFETYENGLAVGHTDSFLEVAAPAPAPLHAALLTVRLQEISGGRLLARIEEV